MRKIAVFSMVFVFFLIGGVLAQPPKLPVELELQYALIAKEHEYIAKLNENVQLKMRLLEPQMVKALGGKEGDKFDWNTKQLVPTPPEQGKKP